jgi:hypothetical protein
MSTSNVTFSPAATSFIVNTDSTPIQFLGIQVSNNSGGALTTFTVGVRCGHSTAFTTIASIAGDYSTPLSPLVRTVGTPVTLANAATAFLLFQCMGIADIQITASAAITMEVTWG